MRLPRFSAGAVPKGARYFLTESLLIVFSILFAMALNSWRIGADERRDVREAAISLYAELNANVAALEDLDDYYLEIAQGLSEIDLEAVSPEATANCILA